MGDGQEEPLKSSRVVDATGVCQERVRVISVEFSKTGDKKWCKFFTTTSTFYCHRAVNFNFCAASIQFGIHYRIIPPILKLKIILDHAWWRVRIIPLHHIIKVSLRILNLCSVQFNIVYSTQTTEYDSIKDLRGYSLCIKL